MQAFEIKGRFPSLNEFYRMNPFQQSLTKKECDERVAAAALAAGIKPCERIKYRVIWVEKNGRRDLDNIAFGKKFIQDGLVKARIIANDNRRYIAGFSDSFCYDKDNPRIIVEIEEVNK